MKSTNSSAKSDEMKRNLGVSWRAVIIGSILLPLTSYWSIRRGIMWSCAPDTLSLHYNVVFTVFFLSLLNILILKRFFKKYALTQGELLVIYIMLSLVTAIGGFDRIQSISTVIGYVFGFATPENEYKEIFSPYLSNWLVVTDEEALKGFYGTESTFYVAEHIKAWFKPVVVWSLFLSVIVFIMLCINVIIRKQWIEKEKLTYPIIQIPIAMTEDGGAKAFFKNKGFWIAFSAAAFVDILNTLHVNFPSLPQLPIRGGGFRFTEKPWNAIGWTYVDLMPFSLAFGFFMPLDLNFSLWFLFLFWKVLRALLVSIGIQSFGIYTKSAYRQISGGCIALGIFALWKARHHLTNVVKEIFIRNGLKDSKEPIKYRWAFLGIIVGVILLVLFFYKVGMPIWVAIVFLGIHLIISIAVTRMRAELGPPFHELLHSGADKVLISLFGSRSLGNSTLAMFIPLSGITAHQRPNAMAYQLEGFKMAESAKISSKRLFFLMLASLVFGAILSFWIMLHSTYKYGTLHTGSWAVPPAKNLMVNPVQPNLSDIFTMGFAFVFTLFLVFMRRFLWWPIHPVAYPLTLAEWGMQRMWFAFMISWFIKKTLLKYGGVKLYRKAFPIFSGLLLGEFVIGGLLTIINLIFDIPIYTFWPG